VLVQGLRMAIENLAHPRSSGPMHTE
jgi:hypothetical protein